LFSQSVSSPSIRRNWRLAAGAIASRLPLVAGVPAAVEPGQGLGGMKG
jgi:hypothetical protein